MVRAAESVRVDTLRHQRIDIVVITSMLTKEARSRGAVPLGSDHKLNNELFGLVRAAQIEFLSAMCATYGVL